MFRVAAAGADVRAIKDTMTFSDFPFGLGEQRETDKDKENANSCQSTETRFPVIIWLYQ